MYMRALLAGIYFVTSAFFSFSLQAADQEPISEKPSYLVEYEAYQAAIDIGDRDTAARHAKAAWEAAEQALGDHRLTAILAFNYGQLIYISDAEEALEPLRRARELVDSGIAQLPDAELRLYISYAEFDLSNFGRRETTALRTALLHSKDPDTSDAITLDDGYMWYRLAQGELRHEHWRRAATSAGKADKIISALDPDNDDLLVRILLIRGVSTLMQGAFNPILIEQAHTFIDRAFYLPPPQKGFDSFDQTFAQVLAWDATIHAVAGSNLRVRGLDTTGEGPRPIFENHIGRPEDCGGEWESQPKPGYPRKAENRGYIGAVVIVYDIGEAGDILNPRILAQVPQDKFGQASLDVMTEWRLKSLPSDHPGCRGNLVTTFEYIIEGYW